jgi:dihydroxy-acid dehydratase
VHFDAGTLAERRQGWKLPDPRYTTGVLAKYARLVTGADQGAITQP